MKVSVGVKDGESVDITRVVHYSTVSSNWGNVHLTE